jgi:mannose-1-phosphate guanylyltransferase/mannose-6-phosphate isomerase
MPDRYVLVLAGGRGERFWPWSRPDRPKQFLPLARDGVSLLAATLTRAQRIAPPERILILTGADLVERTRREVPRGAHVLGEPVGRNTAPAIAAAAMWVENRTPGAAFAVLPSDHAIDDEPAFAVDFERAFAAAERERGLVTFGIPPTAPETALGYVKRGAPTGERLFRVAAFTEKPNRERAIQFLATGEYFWNSGMFVWRADVFLQALTASRPAMVTTLEPLRAASAGEFQGALERVLPACESISVDYAVLEVARDVMMVEASFDWDDLGSWSAWARRQPRDERGNVLHGQAVALDCDGCVVVGEGGIAAALGLENTVVVHTDGATLACPLERSEDVRRVSEAVRARVRS